MSGMAHDVNTIFIMLRRFALRLLLLALGITLPAPAILAQTPPANFAWQPHGDGVAYYCDRNPRIPLAIHIVRIDRSRPDLELQTTLGGRSQIGMAVLSDHVKFISPAVGQAVAAINGDFYNVEPPFVGDPMGLQILRGGELVSVPGVDRAFFYLDAGNQPHVTNAVSQFSITWPDGKVTAVGLNEIPETGQAVLYTTAAGPTTRVEGIDLVLERSGQGPWLPLQIGQAFSAKVREINRKGFSRVTPETLVLSLSPRSLKNYPPLTNGMALKISTATLPDLKGAVLAIGGGPSLVHGGKIRETRGVSGWGVRHPRTALGWDSKYYYFVQVDGRQPRYSMGMTLAELAAYFVKLGCDSAINLDGGGSCTTWFGGKIVNSPSQQRERPSANALVLVRKNTGAKK